MEPTTLTLIILNIVSFLLHGFHLKDRFHCGTNNSCCGCDGEIDEDPSTEELNVPQNSSGSSSVKSKT